jgi:hypothetical protein
MVDMQFFHIKNVFSISKIFAISTEILSSVFGIKCIFRFFIN